MSIFKRCTLWLAAAMALVLVFSGCKKSSSGGGGGSGASGSAAAELAAYAPADTNIIIYVNGRKLLGSRYDNFRSKIQQYRYMKADFEKTEKDCLKDLGVSLSQLLNSEGCLFINVEKCMKKDGFSIIVRTKDPIVGTFIEHVGKQEGVTISNVSGKRMLKSEYSPNLFELSSNLACVVSQNCTTPLTPGSCKLASQIDTNALISVVADCSSLRNVDFGSGSESEMCKALCAKLNQISANLNETGSGLRAEVVAEYDDAEAAQKAHQILAVMKQEIIRKFRRESAELAQKLESKCQLELSGNKVTISIEDSNQEIEDAINSILAEQERQKEKWRRKYHNEY